MDACGDRAGGSWYAAREARGNKVPLLVTFRAPLLDTYVDSRDFLSACFQFWDRQTTEFFDVQSKALERLFGNDIARYFRRASASSDQQYRIATCDLACEDLRVAEDHSRNDVFLRGRYGTTFASAFFVRAPIQARRVVAADIPEVELSTSAHAWKIPLR